MKDPEFLAEAKKQSMDVNPLRAEGHRRHPRRALCDAQDVLEKAAQAIAK